MQSTGLKDSEGTLIYEGDVIEINYCSKHYTVVFRGIGFWFVDEEDDGFVFVTPTYFIKVIGNIYENPSLKH